MSKSNRFLVALAILGVMNFKVLVSATENKVEAASKEENSIRSVENEDQEEFEPRLSWKKEQELAAEKYAMLKEFAKKEENRKKEQKLKEMEDENVKRVLENSEILKWVKIWIDMWGGNLIDLCANKKTIKLKEIKEYLKEIVEKEIEGFDKILDRFKKYEFNFQGIKSEDALEKMRNFAADVGKKIIRENKEINEEYKLEIVKEIVLNYISYVVYDSYLKEGKISDEILDKKIEEEEKEIERRKKVEDLSLNDLIDYGILRVNEMKGIKKINKKSNYKQLIRNAYETRVNPIYLNYSDDVYRKMRKSNFNLYRFNDYDNNLYYSSYYDEDDESSPYYIRWKQGKYDIYSEDSIEEIEKEYEEMNSILEIRKILEEIKKLEETKKIDDKIIFKMSEQMEKFNNLVISTNDPGACIYYELEPEIKMAPSDIRKILEEVKKSEEIERQNNKVCAKGPGSIIYSMLDSFIELKPKESSINEIEETQIDKTIKEYFKRLEYKIKSNISIDKILQNYYFRRFIKVLKHLAEEGASKKFINKIIDLTKEEYYPKRFIEKLENLIDCKYEMLNKVKRMKILLEKLIKRIERNDRYIEDIKFPLDYNDIFEFLYSIRNRNQIFKNSNSLEIAKRFRKNVREEYDKIFNKKEYISNVFDYCYISLYKELIFKYNLVFFEKLEEIISEGVLEELEKAKKIALTIKELSNKKNPEEEDIKKLIEVIRVNINEEEFLKLLKTNSEDLDEIGRCILGKMIRFMNDYKPKSFLNVKEFLKKLKEIVKISCDIHTKKSRMGEIKKELKVITNMKPLCPTESRISDSALERIIGAFKGLIIKDIEDKFRKKTISLRFPRLKMFFEQIINLIECSYSEEEFIKLFNILVEKMNNIDEYEVDSRLLYFKNERLIKYLEGNKEKKDDFDKEKDEIDDEKDGINYIEELNKTF